MLKLLAGKGLFGTMTDNNVSSPSTTRQTSMTSAFVQDVEQRTAPIQTAAIPIPSTAACTGAATAAVNGTCLIKLGELPCQWAECSETAFTAEALYVSS